MSTLKHALTTKPLWTAFYPLTVISSILYLAAVGSNIRLASKFACSFLIFLFVLILISCTVVIYQRGVPIYKKSKLFYLLIAAVVIVSAKAFIFSRLQRILVIIFSSLLLATCLLRSEKRSLPVLFLLLILFLAAFSTALGFQFRSLNGKPTILHSSSLECCAVSPDEAKKLYRVVEEYRAVDVDDLPHPMAAYYTSNKSWIFEHLCFLDKIPYSDNDSTFLSNSLLIVQGEIYVP